MEPVGLTDAVIISDQRTYTMVEALRGKNPTEIHGARLPHSGGRIYIFMMVV